MCRGVWVDEADWQLWHLFILLHPNCERDLDAITVEASFYNMERQVFVRNEEKRVLLQKLVDESSPERQFHYEVEINSV